MFADKVRFDFVESDEHCLVVRRFARDIRQGFGGTLVLLVLDQPSRRFVLEKHGTNEQHPWNDLDGEWDPPLQRS